MKNSRKIFICIEAVLAVMVVILAAIMFRERNGKEVQKVSVIVQNSDDSQWSAFRYGLKMAAQDQGIEMFVVSTGSTLTLEEEKNIIEDEIENGADAVIVQPVPGTDTENMLKKINKKIPVMLVEYTASTNREDSIFPVTGADNYAMGKQLAQELLKDYNDNIEGKTLGLVMENSNSEAVINRKNGLEDVLKDSGVQIRWSLSDISEEERGNSLERQPKVDIVIGLDDNSLTTAGEYAAAKNLHGAVVYGIGNSTEAVYYLDTGIVECLIVPDEFSIGYQSLTEVAESLGLYFTKMKNKTVTHAIIRREELFLPKNQDILFTMSQ